MILRDDEIINKISLEEKEIRLQQIYLLQEVAKRLLSFSDWLKFEAWSKDLTATYKQDQENV